jgi:hypothetical protein
LALAGYLPEYGASCRGFEAAFCCAALVLPDDTCADAVTEAANKTAVTAADITPVLM